MTRPCDIIPMEYNVVVEIAAEETTKGGIILPTMTVDKDKLAADEGELIAVSPLAFNFDNWPEGARRPRVGDRVLVARYAGVLRDKDGRALRICKDKDIIAIVEAATPVAAAA